MNTLVLIAGSQLLKNIHITKLQVVAYIDMISKPREKTGLIKIIVHDLFAEVDMYFIIDYKR